MSAQHKKVRQFQSHLVEQHEIEMEMKSRKKRGLFRRLCALSVFVIVVAVTTVLTLHSQNSVFEQKREQKELLEKELNKLVLLERDLLDEAQNLTNLEYISEIARRDYFLTKPGEIIFKVTNTPSD